MKMDRATALVVAECVFEENVPKPVKVQKRVIEADLIVSAIGQSPDIEGYEEMGNEKAFLMLMIFTDTKQKKAILLLVIS